jgi:hypothetical protein
MNSKSDEIGEQKLLEPWLTVIEMLTVFWSPVEREIDRCVYLLYEEPDAKKKPLTLRRKLDYIQRNLPPILYSKAELDALIKATKETVQIRDVCVHGVIESYDINELIIGKIQGKELSHTIEVFTITSERLKISTESISRLVEHWSYIAKKLRI